MANNEKTCVICGESCTGQPRIKNNKGQYAHKTCAKQQEQQQDQEQHAHDDVFDGGMDDLFDDIDPANICAPQKTTACQGCGQAINIGSVICMECGYNQTTGEQIQHAKAKDHSPRPRPEAKVAQAAMDSVVGQIMLPIFGGCIGGLIGMGIWSAVAYYGQIRFAILAWGIGALVGLGVNIGSRDTGGVIFGMFGAVIAGGAVAGGNYFTATLLANEFIETLEPDDVSDSFAMGAVVVWDVLFEWESRGDEIPWPLEWKTWDLADWPDDFPEVIIDETNTKWQELSYDDQYLIREQIAEATHANSRLIEHDIIEIGFIGLMKHPINIIFMTLSICTAFLFAAYK